MACGKRTAQEPGRPYLLLAVVPTIRRCRFTFSDGCTYANHVHSAKKSVRSEVRHGQGEPEPMLMGEGSRRTAYERRRRERGGAQSRPSKGGPCHHERQEGPMADSSRSSGMSHGFPMGRYADSSARACALASLTVGRGRGRREERRRDRSCHRCWTTSTFTTYWTGGSRARFVHDFVDEPCWCDTRMISRSPSRNRRTQNE